MSQPGPEPAAIRGQHGRKDLAVLTEPPSVRAALADDQRTADERRRPSEPFGDPGSQALLAIEDPDRFADVDDGGLDLDHEQGPRLGVPREDVDEASLAALAEGHLRPGLPPKSPKLSKHGGNEVGVVGRRETCQVPMSRPRRELQANLEHSGDRAEDPNRQRREMATLDPGHRLDGHARGRRDVALAPGAPDAHHPEHRPDSLVIHRSYEA